MRGKGEVMCEGGRGRYSVRVEGGGSVRERGGRAQAATFILRHRFHPRASFSFVGGCLGSWAVVFIHVCGPSPSFMGGHLCLWAVACNR